MAMQPHRLPLFLALFSFLLPSALFPSAARGQGSEAGPAPFDATMLMFVGEADPLVTVASRQPEAPQSAPALVTVVGRAEIKRFGYRTLAELLADQPGFFIAASGRGSVVYLRGLRDAVLFLYDGAPLAIDAAKGLVPIDHELSLLAVERVEIVRGAGSVLWGADAFAGVVNIVPRRGRATPGWETSLAASAPAAWNGAAAWSGAGPDWDAFLALAGDRSLVHDPEFIGGEVPASRAAELAGTINYRDWLHISGRWSDFTHHGVMHNGTGDLSWGGEREIPLNLLKATVSQVVGASHYTFSGFVQEASYRIRDSDFERGQRNLTQQLEFLWDRRLLARSLFTAGLSWRRNKVSGVVVRDGFLPDFLASGSLFRPSTDQESYHNELLSFFGQFRGHWGENEWWLGGRLDDHSQYQSTISYSLGLNRPLGEDFRAKLSWGSAFRTPYAAQLFAGEKINPEAIATAALQFAWAPAPERGAELTVFHSRLDDHRAEDPYGGLSLPASRTLYGLELTGRAPLVAALSLDAAVSLLSSPGQEQFRVLRYAIIRPDGSTTAVYDQWDEPVDRGPGWLARLALLYRFAPKHTLRLAGRFGGELAYSYSKGAIEGDYSHPLLLDLTYRRNQFTLRLTNLLDQNYQQPDLFGPTTGPPLTATLTWHNTF